MIDQLMPGIRSRARRFSPRNLAEQDDLVGDATLAAVRALEKYKDLPESSRIKLAGRAAVNAMNDRKRKERPVFDLTIFPILDTSAAHKLSEVELSDMVDSLKVNLSERSQAVLELRLQHQLTGGEIAKKIGVSPASVSRSFSEIREIAEGLGLSETTS